MGQISRRQFLQYAAAGAATASLGSKHARQLISPPKPLANEEPGLPTVYATTCRECPAGCGMHVWNREGRAVKAEGSPDHPVSRGGLCARGQSSLQGLYDPDRVGGVLRRAGSGEQVAGSWEAALAEISKRLTEPRGRVVLLSDLQRGALDEVMRAFAGQVAGGKPLYYEPVDYQALARAYGWLGEPALPRFELGDCRLIVSFAADFLETWISPVEFTHAFSQMRVRPQGQMGRLLYVGPWQSMTAANADEFWKVSPQAVRWAALALLHEVLESGRAQDVERIRAAAQGYDLPSAAGRAGIGREKLQRLAELFCQEGPTVALAGPAMAQDAVAYDTAVATVLLNYAAVRIGKTVLDRKSVV
jgi:anaerobic selenocysteine-containing dehydrogenase